MKLVELNKPKGLFFKVSDCDYERVSWHKWRYDRSTKYIVACIGSQVVHLHRYILEIKDPKVDVDHINRNKFDATRENLSAGTRQQNSINQSKRNGNYSSQFIGVSWYKKEQKWRAHITQDGVFIHLGYFNSEEKAARIRDEAAKKYFGKRAVLNFPEEKGGLNEH